MMIVKMSEFGDNKFIKRLVRYLGESSTTDTATGFDPQLESIVSSAKKQLRCRVQTLQRSCDDVGQPARILFQQSRRDK